MLYFKNSELAEKYRISLGTVRNWIDASIDGKLDLDLIKKDDRHFIGNSQENIQLMDQLVEDNRKFRNKKAVKRTVPRDEFYDLFSEQQIYDIATSLEVHHELPLQYSYFNGGAASWDEYTRKLSDSSTENSFTAAQQLLQKSLGYLDTLMEGYDRVNVIDIGPGNAMPVRRLLEHLLKKKKSGRYIALDMSPAMLKIAESNINQWFGDQIKFEGYIRNVEHERFSDLLVSEYLEENSRTTMNIILHLGYTLRNMQDSENGYRTIHSSIGKNDLLIEDNMLDTDNTRSYFNFDDPAVNVSPMPSLLNLDPEYYEVELGFDDKSWQRYEKIRFKIAIDIDFKFKNGTRTVTFNKGDTVLMWRNKHNSVEALLQQRDHTGLTPVFLCKTDSMEYMLTIFRVKLS